MANYFTRAIVVGNDVYKTKKASELEDTCEHVQNDPIKLYIVLREKDSFGTVSEMGLCEECYQRLRQTEDDEEVYCYDCNQKKRRSETISWAPYDFYAEQGDEVIIVCRECESKSRHRHRVEEDELAYNAEMGYEDDF